MILPAALLLCAAVHSGAAAAQGNAKYGEYLAKLAGCMGCHTADKKDAVPFAGGRDLKTPLGIFYGPNITMHPSAGIGRWTEADFVRAMREGVRPDGAHYFASFPYASFSGITDDDLRDLWAYLRMVPPSSQANQPHDLKFPYGWRPLLVVLKWLYFKPGSYAGDPKLTPIQNRGAYLVNTLGYCGECHTPRNFLGAPKKDRWLAGTRGASSNESATNLTPTGLQKWSDGELRDRLTRGKAPGTGAPPTAMADVVRNSTSQLSTEDLSAMISYLRTLPPLPDEK